MARNMKMELLTLYCISRKTVDTEYTYYSWCMTSTDIVKWRKNEWLWTFWKTNDLYENFEKKGVVEKRGEEETKSMPHAPAICLSKHPANSSARWTECITGVSECSIKNAAKYENSEWMPWNSNMIRIMNKIKTYQYSLHFRKICMVGDHKHLFH
jgi:hypothetical protein